MPRNCPVCHQKLASSDIYYCGNCGTELDEKAILRNDVVKKVTDMEWKPASQGVKVEHFTSVAKDVVDITNLKGIVVLFLVLIILGLPAYIFLSGLDRDLAYLLKGSQATTLSNTRSSHPVNPNKTVGTYSTGLAGKSGTFGSIETLRFVPYSADTYFEGFDFSELALIVGENNKDYLGILNEINLVASGHFFGYTKSEGGAVNWAVFVEIEPSKLGQGPDIPKLKESYEKLFIKLMSGHVVVTNKESAVMTEKEMQEALTKNLSMNPAYVSSKAKMNPQGRVLVVSVTGEGRDAVSKFIQQNIPSLMKSILNALLENKVNYVVGV